jgi:hypothetical protein
MSEIGGSRGSAWQTRVRAAGFPPSSTSSGTRASVRGPGAPGHRGGPAGPSSLFADRHDAIGTVAPRDRRSQGTMEPPHSRAQLVLRPGTCDRPPGGARDQSRAEADPPSRRGRLRWLARDRSRWRSRVGGWEARERGTGRGGATRRRLGSPGARDRSPWRPRVGGWEAREPGPVAVAATRRRLGGPGARDRSRWGHASAAGKRGTGRRGGHASAAGRPGSRDRSRWRSGVGGWEAREPGPSRWRSGVGGREARERGTGRGGGQASAAGKRGTGRGGAGNASAAGRPGSAGPSRWRSGVGGWEAPERGTVAVGPHVGGWEARERGTGRGGGHASAAGRPGSAGPVAVGPAAGRPPPAPGRPPPETTRSRRCGPLVVVWGAHARQSDHGRRPGERGGRFGAKRAPNRPQVPRSPCRWSIGGDGTG